MTPRLYTLIREPFEGERVSLFREPDAGNLPVRFDERGYGVVTAPAVPASAQAKKPNILVIEQTTQACANAWFQQMREPCGVFNPVRNGSATHESQAFRIGLA